jgi:SAM-dependent methyltransferase
MSNDLTLLVHPKMTEVLQNVVRMFEFGLRALGIEARVANGLQGAYQERAIVFGANFFDETQLHSLSRNSVIFNVENIQSYFMDDQYYAILRNFHVWDYNPTNAAALSLRLDRSVQYAKLFYVDQLSRITGEISRDIDVLFYGSYNDRRITIIEELRARGLIVTAVYKIFGAELDALIRRAKVVINIHYYDNGHLELIRLFDLLANGCAVVSELNAGEHVDEDLANALVFAPYDQLVDATEALARDNERRGQVACAALRSFSARTAKDVLPALLANSEPPVLLAKATIGSGKAYDPKVLNIDINESWHPDIVADISDLGLFARDLHSTRFGTIRLKRGWFDKISASHVIEHIPNLTQAMANFRDLLREGGTFHVDVPYDLSYGAWQDPTHVHAFNERSWLYYCEWYWYLGWDDARFDLVSIDFVYSSIGHELAARNISQDEILRMPRAVDEMRVVLQKRQLNEHERAYGLEMRGEARFSPDKGK